MPQDKPLPPAILLSALQDKVHEDGPGRAAKSVKEPRMTTEWNSLPAQMTKEGTLMCPECGGDRLMQVRNEYENTRNVSYEGTSRIQFACESCVDRNGVVSLFELRFFRWEGRMWSEWRPVPTS